jgi:hypothetical protein
MTPLEQSQQELVRSGVRKQSAGQKLSREESAAVKRFLKEKEERERLEYYRTVPQKHYEQMSGRQRKVLKEQAGLYALPIGEKVIDLFAVLRRYHDLLAEHGHKLLKAEDPGVLSGPPTESLERLRLAKAKREEFAYRRELGQYRSVEDVQHGLAIFAGVIRQAIETLQREHGEEARAIMAEALEEAGAAFARMAMSGGESGSGEHVFDVDNDSASFAAAHAGDGDETRSDAT